MLWCGCAAAKEYPLLDSDLRADTWVATDGAGRKLPGFNECGPRRKDRWVGIFYWTWHRSQSAGPNDNTRILATATNGTVHWPDNGAPYHWGEPELGYYLMTDSETMPDWFGMPEDNDLPSNFLVEYVRAWKKVPQQ